MPTASGIPREKHIPSGRFRTGVLTADDYAAILGSTESHSELARRFDVTEGAIRYVRRTRGVRTTTLDLGNHAPLVTLANPGAAQSYLVERSAIDAVGCWIWKGATDVRGYGQAYVGDEHVQAHRLARLAFVGPFDHRLVVRHSCNVRACVNPAHLEIGTQADNIADAVKLGRHPHGATHGRYRGHLPSLPGVASPSAAPAGAR